MKPAYPGSGQLGLHIGLHFSPAHTAYCFATVFGLFLASWGTFYAVWRATLNRTVRVSTTVAIALGWGYGWYVLQPRDPYWINELSVTTYILAVWHMADWLLWRLHEQIPKQLSLGSFLLHEALVLRPSVLRHSPGHRPPTHRQWTQRVRDALPSLGTFALQYVCCESLNAWLMQQEREWLLHGPLPYRVLASLAFACALYFHLSYFFNIMAFANIILFDQEPEDWPAPFQAPWKAASPTEFWNERWHSMFRHHFTRLVYKPLLRCLRTLTHSHPHTHSHTATPPPTGPIKLISTHQSDTSDNEWSIPASPKAVSIGAVGSILQGRSRATGREGTPRRSSRLAALKAGTGTPEPATGLSKTDTASQQYSPSSSIQRAATPATSLDTDSHSAQAVRRRGNSGSVASAAPVSASGHIHGKGAQQVVVRGRGPHSTAAPGSTGRHRDPAWVHAVCVLAVFMASGLFHELTLMLFFGAPTGEQLAFFVLHGAVVLAERAAAPALCASRLVRRVPRWARVAATNVFLASSTLIFIRPWFRQSYHKQLRVPVPDPIHFAVARWSREGAW